MKSNQKKSEVNAITHQGGAAAIESAEKELRRAVSCCMLFEDTFYEKGNEIADRIKDLCGKVSMQFMSYLAVKAREDLKLRHVPLFLCCQMLANKKDKREAERRMVGDTIAKVIQRADELAEIMAVYRKLGGKGEPRQLKAGIAKAFRKFSAYNLAKYNRDSAWKLRDALFVSHAKPQDAAQAATWKKLVEGTLEAPDTWEVALSAGKDKKETFTRLITEGKLGYMALLRNLRNMEEAGVDRPLVRKALLEKASGSKALPFRFVAAARFAPSFAQDVSDALLEALKDNAPLKGKTAILVDVSSSMMGKLSGKSEMDRIDAASALAALLREISDTRVFAYSDRMVEVLSLRGMGLVEAVRHSPVTGGGTATGGAINGVLRAVENLDRIFVVTDEQANDNIPALNLKTKGYIINVAPYKPALPHMGGSWTRVSGWSERIVDWVREEEAVG